VPLSWESLRGALSSLRIGAEFPFAPERGTR
jgi:hypothetical protein